MITVKLLHIKVSTKGAKRKKSWKFDARIGSGGNLEIRMNDSYEKQYHCRLHNFAGEARNLLRSGKNSENPEKIIQSANLLK